MGETYWKKLDRMSREYQESSKRVEETLKKQASNFSDVESIINSREVIDIDFEVIESKLTRE